MSYVDAFETNTGGLGGFRSNFKVGDINLFTLNGLPFVAATGATGLFQGPTGPTGAAGVTGPTGSLSGYVPAGYTGTAPFFFGDGSSLGCGNQNLSSNTAAKYNTVYGVNSYSTSGTGTNNTAFGYHCLTSLTTGIDDIAIGTLALQSTTTGSQNIAIGDNALNSNVTGGQNVAIGYNTLQLISSGFGNTVIGYEAGQEATGNGSYNTYVGFQAGLNNQYSYNTCLGANAISGGTGNIVIGSNATLTGANWGIAIGDSNFASNSVLSTSSTPSYTYQLVLYINDVAYYVPLSTVRF